MKITSNRQKIAAQRQIANIEGQIAKVRKDREFYDRMETELSAQIAEIQIAIREYENPEPVQKSLTEVA